MDALPGGLHFPGAFGGRRAITQDAVNQPMGMHDAVLAKLEYPVILERLARHCRFGVAVEHARELGPSADPATVKYLLDVTSEAVDLLTNFPEISIGGARDVRPLTAKAAKGGRLQPADLLMVLDMVSSARVLRRTFLRLPEVDTRFPEMVRFIDHLAELPDIETDINRSIGPRGDILDTASMSLADIRRDVRVAQARLMERLNTLVTGNRYGSALQDAIVTTRDGRYVVPVKAEMRSVVPGVVHDTSASGQTLFIEPFDVVELNNKWRERQIDEEREIERILDRLSAAIGDRASQIDASVEAAAAVDLAMAKALLAFELRAHRPRMIGIDEPLEAGDPHGSATHRITPVKARHPLLDPATVVPISLEIGASYRVLVITGPNTGGKTVALKTVGLLALMAQTGLFIPAEDTSVLSVFPAVFVDIGDEQSIAQSLSTFSAHMRNVISMLDHLTPDSLVLLDEMGAGTDPQEGSALARSLIAELLERGPITIATTHYSEVKAYAYATPGVENASVEFDVASLAPTYRLMVGVPGRSNALAIARRLGMPDRVLDRAANLLDPDEIRADTLLEDIRSRRTEAEEALARARATEDEARQLRLIAARELRTAEEERRDARAEALAEAETELLEVRETLKRLQRDRDALSVTREHVEGRKQEVDAAADRVRTFRRDLARRTVRREMPKQTITPGDRVRITALQQEGEVTAVSDGMADVRMGSLKVRQPLEALERLGRAKAVAAERTVILPPPSAPVDIELDLRGLRANDVGELLERYLDDAVSNGMPFVRIIHGKGTGALRNVVREFLSDHPAVAKYELAPQAQGGDGATVATLRDR